MTYIVGQDSFNRTVSSGSWGDADIGGPWTVLQGGGVNFSVQSGQGRVAMTPNATRDIAMNSISTIETVTRVAFTSSSGFNGGPQTINIIGRYIAPNDCLMARVRIEDGIMRLYLMRGNETAVAHYPLAHSYSAGEKVWCEVSIAGTNPTTVAGKIWLDTSTEPTEYQISGTDTTLALQEAGSVVLRTTFSGGASAAIVAYSDFSVVDPTFASLDTPTVTLSSTSPTTTGGADGTVTASWSSIPGADYYETALVSGTTTSGFVADDTNATSPKTYTGLPAGIYTVAVRAKAD